MPSGGARSNSGPAPDPDALRRDRPSDRREWVELPAAGRKGRAPVWPLAVEATERELQLWRRLWRLPQAAAWEAAGDQDAVALYVRTFVEAEAPEATASMRNAVLRMRDALGLSVVGMRANRWRLAKPKPEQTQAGEPVHSPALERRRATGSARDRFKVVKGDAGPPA